MRRFLAGTQRLGTASAVIAGVLALLLASTTTAQDRPSRPKFKLDSPKPEANQPAAREQAVRDPAVREPSSREPVLREPATRERRSREPAEDGSLPPDTPASLDGGATVNPALLTSVRDDTLGLEPEDRHAYFFILWLCRELGAETIAQWARLFREERRAANPKHAQLPASEFPTFADVFRNPDVYRGRPVTLHGYFRRLVKFEPGDNDLGVKHVYEGWIYTHDSQNNPAVVIFTKKPPGLPIGGDITEEVRFSGYFLKMYGYEAQDTTRRAPLFIAGEVEWFPHQPANATVPMPPWVYVAVGLGMLLGAWGLWRTAQVHHRRGLPAVIEPPGRGTVDDSPFTDGDRQRPIEHHH